jgi:hypothetical protein
MAVSRLPPAGSKAARHETTPAKNPDITPEAFYRKYNLPNVSENAIRAALGLPVKTDY